MLEHLFDDEEEEDPFASLAPLAEDNMEIPSYETPALDKFMSFINNVPQRADYQPSFGSKLKASLVGGLTGLGTRSPEKGIELGQSMLDTPYKQALGDFQTQANMMGTAASYENKQGESKRKYVKDLLQKANMSRKYLLEMQKAATAHEDKLKAIESMEKRHGVTEESKRQRHEAEMAWKKVSFDKTMAVRQAHLGIAQQSLALSKQREARLGKDDDIIKVGEQKAIDRQAATEVSRDPRFTKWFVDDPDDPRYGEFNTALEDHKGNRTEMDEATKTALSNELAKAKQRVATTKRSSYEQIRTDENPYMSPMTPKRGDPFDWDLFDEDDEEESPYLPR